MKLAAGTMKLAAALLTTLSCVGALIATPSKYILVTSPSEKALYVSEVPGAREMSTSRKMRARKLTPSSWSSVVFEKPEGLAVDSVRGLLYVADIGKKAIIAMTVYEKNEFLTDASVAPMAHNGTLHVEDPREIITDVHARWVAVDSVGNLFWTELNTNGIYTMSLDTIRDKLESSPSSLSSNTDATENATTASADTATDTSADVAAEGTTDEAEGSTDASATAPVVSALQMSVNEDADATDDPGGAAPAPSVAGTAPWQTTEQTDEAVTQHAVQLYNGLGLAAVAKPQGLAVDGFSIYWANGQEGQAEGVLVKGLEDPPDDDRDSQLERLATNIDRAEGVCLTGSRVFFTGHEKAIYSMRTNGGSAKLVSDRLAQPRGCVYDGDGTVYVADRMAGKVYSFAGASPSLGGRQLNPAFDVVDAHGLAIFRGQAGRSHCTLTVLLAVMIAFLQ